MISSGTVLALGAATDSAAGEKVTLPPWLQIVLAVLPIATLVLGLPFVSRLGKNSGAENRKLTLESRQVELENEKLEIELEQLRGRGGSASEKQELERSIEAISERRARVEAQVADARSAGGHGLLEGVVARFALLYLTLHAWGLLSSLFSLIVFSAFGGFFLDRLVSLFFVTGDMAITLVLGLPLLRDVFGVDLKGARWLGRSPRHQSLS